jgi:hypothetical protein
MGFNLGFKGLKAPYHLNILILYNRIEAKLPQNKLRKIPLPIIQMA